VEEPSRIKGKESTRGRRDHAVPKKQNRLPLPEVSLASGKGGKKERRAPDRASVKRRKRGRHFSAF